MNLIILGAPGAGKGTQGSFLAADMGLKRLSTGDLFRAILKDEKHPLYNSVKVMKQGSLLPDAVVNQVVEDYIAEHKDENFLFDGYPRTLEQAKALDEIMEKFGKKIDCVVNLNVSRDVLFYRLLGRLTCRNCKHTVHESDHFQVCPKCGGELYTREDDNENSIRQRFEEYNKKTAPLIAYYQNHDICFVDVAVNDKDVAIEDVRSMIKDALNKTFQK